jgi:hypothetical protein
LRNLLYTLGNVSDAASEENVQPGQIKTLRPGTTLERLEVTDPKGGKEVVPRSNQLDFPYKSTEEVGVYQAAWPNGQRSFSVNLLDADESNIQPREEIQLGSRRLAAGQVRRQTYDLWKWGALAALVLLVLEWAVYHRRILF